jgi:hypothetical protein
MLDIDGDWFGSMSDLSVAVFNPPPNSRVVKYLIATVAPKRESG